MDSLASTQVKSASVLGGSLNAKAVARGGVQQQVKKQEAVAAPSVEAPKVLKEGGVTTSTTAEGYLSKTADSGVSLLQSERGQEITLPGGEAFRLNGQELTALNEESAKSATLTSSDGTTLISFQDKDQNTVRIQPESLTYEVLNKQRNLSQVYYPDGFQEVVAFGKFRTDGKTSDYQHSVVYDPSGQMVESNGFSGLSVEGRKLSFDLGNGVRTERQLAKPLPGQAPFEETTVQVQANEAASPLAIFGEQPVLGTAQVAPTTVAAVSEKPLADDVAPPTVEDAALAEFQALPNLSQDFFAGAGAEGVSFDQTPSGLVMRHEGNSRAFLLTNGDAFRTDGKNLEVLGENPRVKNVRLVDQGEDQLLAYSDAEGNRHTLNVNSGDYEVSNRQGSLTQGIRVDGTRDYAVRGIYTSESGQPQQYQNTASFGPTGTLLSKEGFDDIRVDGDKLAFSLPNGEVTDRTLIEASDVPINIEKKLVLTGGFAEEWGTALSLAEEFLNPTAAGAATSAPGAASAAPLPERPVGAPVQVRQPLQDGGSVSTLPNGVQIVDGKELFATDAMGNRLNVQKSQLASETGDSYLLSVRTQDGIEYTISNTNLDMIVQSADGKVHQLVGPTGKILTSIMDPATGSQHMHELDSFAGSTGSPGVRLDPRFPDRIFIDGSPVGSYQVPHPFGPAQPTSPQGPASTPGDQGMPSGQDPDWARGVNGGAQGFDPASGGVQEGYRPGFWQRFKGAFTGENPWNPDSARSGSFDPRAMSGQAPYPGAQYGPQGGQWAQPMSPMMGAGMGMGMMSMMSMMPMMNMMFFSPFGMF